MRRRWWVPRVSKVHRALDEIYAGVFDGMTYEEINEVAPEEFKARANDKLNYRYPRGESYLDVIQRLDQACPLLQQPVHSWCTMTIPPSVLAPSQRGRHPPMSSLPLSCHHMPSNRRTNHADATDRIDQVIHELERHRDPVLVIAHQGIIRVLYA